MNFNPLHNKRTLGLIAPIIFLLVYLFTLTSHHSEAEDALAYAYNVSKGDPLLLFHPNHLLFESISLLFFNFLSWFSSSITVLTSMQVLQSIAGALSLLIGIRIGRHLKLPDFWIFFYTCCIGFSYGYWAYSVEADVYILPIVFIMLAIHQLIRVTEENWSYACLAKISLYLSAATLIYQQHILLFFVFSITLVVVQRNNQSISFLDLSKKLVVVFGTSAFVIIGIYLSVALLNPNVKDVDSLRDAILWSLGHGQHGLYSEFGLASFAKSLVGFYKGIWGPNFLFGFEWFQELVRQFLPGMPGLEETYLSNTLPGLVKYSSLIFLIAGLTSFGGCLFLIARNFSVTVNRFKKEPYALFSLVFFLVYGTFNTLYFPENLEFWIATIPVFFVLLAYLLNQVSGHSTVSRVLSIAIITGILVPNSLGSIIPQSTDKGDYWREHTQYYIEQTTPDDIVILNCGWGCTPRLRWWSPAKIHHLHELTPDRVEDLFSQKDGSRIFISSWVWSPPGGITLAKWNLDPALLTLTIDAILQYRSQMELIYSDDTQDIYRLAIKSQTIGQ